MGKFFGWGALIVTILVGSVLFAWYLIQFLFYLAQIIFIILVFLVRLFIAFLVLLKDWTNEYLERRRVAARTAARPKRPAPQRRRTTIPALTRPAPPKRPTLRRKAK